MLHYAIPKAMRERSPTPLSVLYKSSSILQNSLEVIPLFHFRVRLTALEVQTSNTLSNGRYICALLQQTTPHRNTIGGPG